MVYLPSSCASEVMPLTSPGVTVSRVPFNQPFISNREMNYICAALNSGHISGDGAFTKRCHAWLKAQIGSLGALLTHSCTAALEMAAILADVQAGDEVILPSYTFVSTANAFVLRGAVPVFVDIRPDTLNLDESLIEAAITPKTKAIVPVHYAGVSCDMDTIRAIAERHHLLVVEDAAQAIGSRYRGNPVGSLGHLSCFSFHETKNIVSGEGGAIVINDPQFLERAEIIREKGTNRSQFFRGEVDKYTWVDLGSSFLPSDILAAMLWAQFEQADYIQQRRMDLWQFYHETFAALETSGKARRPIVPSDCEHNAHLYYLLVENLEIRTALLAYLKSRGVQATFHYVPLHSAPAGQKYGRVAGSLPHTDTLSDRIVRLPLGGSMSQKEAEYVAAVVLDFMEHH